MRKSQKNEIKIMIDDHTAKKALNMCEKMWEDPNVQAGYAQWHLQEYGCLPEDDQIKSALEAATSKGAQGK